MILRRRRLPSKAVLLAVVVASGGQSCRNGEGRVSLPRGVNRDAFVATSSAAPLRRSASSAYQRHGRSPAEPLCLRIKKAGVDGRQQRPCIVAELPVSAAGAAGAETNEQDPPAEHVNGSHTGGQEEADEDLWSSVEWAGERDGMSGGGSEAMVGSQEFVSLVKAQFDLLSTVLGAHRVLLFVRRESSETGALEFVPAMEVDCTRVEQKAHRPGRHLVLPATAGKTTRTESWDTPDAVEGDDGSLSAPVMYASLVLGMITVFKSGARYDVAAEGKGDRVAVGEGEGGAGPVSIGERLSQGGGEQAEAVWDQRDKRVLETVASSVAIGAVLDQKQRWAAVMQVEPLRRVVAESLHQVKNPMTALRTFGKLLLRRLPQEDILNRELAKDIILQSDRLIDILLPVDAVLGMLATAVEREREAQQVPGMVDPHLAQREGLAAAAAAATSAAAAAAAAATATADGAANGVVFGAGGGSGGVAGSVPQGVQDALLSPSAPTGLEESLAWEEMNGGVPFGPLSVEDVVGRVTRAAQVAAKERRVGFRWRVDDNLPKVVGDERALEEALSNVVENALKFCKMGRGEGGKDGGVRAMVVLRARCSGETEWGAESGGVVVEVVDNGPGVEAEDLPYIFDRGYRGRQALQCDIPGTGLGLGIARDTMRSFGGDLEVVNMNPGKDLIEGEEERGWGAGVKLYLPRDRRREAKE